MQKFISHIIQWGVLLVIVLVICSCLFNLLIPIRTLDESNYLFTWKEKLSYFDQTQDASRRIILIGGSNLFFGVNSRRLENKFQCPVINIGVHAGCGFATILRTIRPYIRANDQLIFAAEYALWGGGWDGGDARWYLEYDVFQRSFLSGILNPYCFSLKSINNYVRLKFKRIFLPLPPMSGVYSSGNINPSGDSLSTRITDKRIKSSIIHIGQFQEKEFSTFLKSISSEFPSMRYYISCPALQYSSYNLNKNAINQFYKQLSQLPKVTIISQPENYAFKDEYIYDTIYHLTNEGAEKRTDQLILDMKQYLNSNE